MTTKSKVPQIYFNGFSRELVEKRLGDICIIGDIDHRMPKSVLEGIPYLMTGDFLDNNGLDFKNCKFISIEDYEQLSRKIRPEANDILFARYASVGDVRYVETDIKFLISYSCAIIKCNKDIIGRFLFYYLQSNRIQYQIEININTGSQRNIGIDSLKKLTIFIPKIEEQTKIGDYFQQIDKLIEQKEKKYQKLKQFKKAMLNKMFPKNGADTPEIRFKDFNGKWEEKKLGDIFNYERPDNYIVKSTEYSNENKIPVLTANKAFILGYTNELNTFNKPSIIFDDFTLDFKFVDFPYMVKSSALKILTINNENKDSLIFIYNLLHTIKIEIMGHARHYIGVVQPTNVFVPKIEEQEKIGNYFQKLDNQIDLQQKELEKLKNIKKASLAKMFV
jgi:type I restriction enzyme S subunit